MAVDIPFLSLVFYCVVAVRCSASNINGLHTFIYEKFEFFFSGSVDTEMKPGVLSTLFQCSERLTSPTVCFEALQVIFPYWLQPRVS